MTLPPTLAAWRAGRVSDLRGLGIGLVLLVSCALAVVAVTTVDQQATGSAALWLVAAPLAVAFVYLVSLGPKWCLSLLLASMVFGLAKYGTTVGSIDVRVPDFFYAALVVWALLSRAREGQRGYLVGRRVLVLWLAALGLSLFPLLVQGTASTDSLVAWLRLVVTLSLIWLVPYAVRTPRDVHFILGTLALAGTIEVGRAIVVNLLRGDLASRLEGATGPNTTGLIAALVVILAIHGPVPRHRVLRLTMLVVGATGLLMTRSLGSTAALVVALGIYGLTSAGRWRAGSRPGLVTPWRLLVVVLVGLAVAAALRPSNLPGSEDFGYSSTMHRVVLADAGLRLFADHPVTGIGWQRTPEEIGARELNAELRHRWGSTVNPTFFPRGSRSTHVHNAYIQVLTEAGVVGFVLFVLALVTLGVGVFRVLRDARPHHVLFVSGRAALVLLVATMIWLNDNPFYGAQPETVLAATFLGIISAIPPMLRAARSRAAS